MFSNSKSTTRNILGAGILSLMLIATGCAGITDPGLNQDQPVDQSTTQTEKVDEDANDNSDVEPFSNDDEPGVIYDEPEL